MAPPTLWDHAYALSGELILEKGPGLGDVRRSFPLPPVMESTYSPEARTITFLGVTEPDDEGLWYGMGLQFFVNDETAARTNMLALITPGEKGGTITLSFPMKRSVPWLSLPTGDRASTSVAQGRYRLEIQRPGRTSWKITLRPSGRREPLPWLETASFSIDASSAKPPWSAVRVVFEVTNERGRAFGTFALNTR